ncbi:MAG: hypothetical protein ACO3CI_04225 [Schleiferiaceae bacterium]
MKKITLALSLLLFISCSFENSGVLMQNEIPQSVYTYAATHQILDEGETIVTYYDATISLSNEESAMITNKHVIYHYNGRTTKMPLQDIVSINHTEETLVGDIITVESLDGNMMKIEIAPLNGGEIFLSVLRSKTNM